MQSAGHWSGGFGSQPRKSVSDDGRPQKPKVPKATTITRVFDQDVFDSILSSIYAPEVNGVHADSNSAGCSNTRWAVARVADACSYHMR
jgi:hypothetical protein